MNFIRSLTLLALVAGISAQGVSTIKYFQSEDDLLRGTAMKSSAIADDPYIQVLYNSNDPEGFKSSVYSSFT